MTKRIKIFDDPAAKEREYKARIAFSGLNQRAVAREVKVDPALVCRTVKGINRNKRVLDFLESLPFVSMVS
jgi:hypothetical protein